MSQEGTMLKITYIVENEDIGSFRWVDYTETPPSGEVQRAQFQLMIPQAQAWRRGTSVPDYAWKRHIEIEEIGRKAAYEAQVA